MFRRSKTSADSYLSWSDPLRFAAAHSKTTRRVRSQAAFANRVPRAGVEPARPYGQRILSPLPGESQHSTTRYQAVFTNVSAVKAT